MAARSFSPARSQLALEPLDVPEAAELLADLLEHADRREAVAEQHRAARRVRERHATHRPVPPARADGGEQRGEERAPVAAAGVLAREVHAELGRARVRGLRAPRPAPAEADGLPADVEREEVVLPAGEALVVPSTALLERRRLEVE